MVLAETQRGHKSYVRLRLQDGSAKQAGAENPDDRIVSGGIVALTSSRYPDLVIGFIIAVLVSRGGFQILREARTLPVVENETAKCIN